MKKKLEELNLDELEELIKNSSEINDPINHRNDTILFVQHFNLKPGTNRVSLKQIYELYTKWSEAPINRNFFSEELGLLFEKRHSNNLVFVLLDKDAINFHREIAKLKPEKRNKTKSRVWSDHFNAFKNYLQIKSGTFWIPLNVMHSLYDKWTYMNKARSGLSEFQFRKFLDLYFESKIIYGKHWFGVDHSIKNHLSQDLIDVIKNKGKFQHGPKKEKK